MTKIMLKAITAKTIVPTFEASIIIAWYAFVQTVDSVSISTVLFWMIIFSAAFVIVFMAGAWWQHTFATSDLRARIRALETDQKEDDERLVDMRGRQVILLRTLEQIQEERDRLKAEIERAS